MTELEYRLMVTKKNLPEEMKEKKRWCYFKAIPAEGRVDKLVLSAIGDGKSRARCNNESDWTTIDEAIKMAVKKNATGITYVLKKDDGITCIDLDDCLTDKGDFEKEIPKKLAERFKGTYQEKSVSGSGIHIFCKGSLPNDAKKHTDIIEAYDDVRMICVTGNVLNNAPSKLADCQNQIDETVKEYLKREPVKPIVARSTSPLSMSDSELIDKIEKSKGGTKFRQLMSGNPGRNKPSGEPDWSFGDVSLCCILAFWTRDEGQIDRIYRQSALYTAPRSTVQGSTLKWDKRTGGSTYGAVVIRDALAKVTNYYDANYMSYKSKQKQEKSCKSKQGFEDER